MSPQGVVFEKKEERKKIIFSLGQALVLGFYFRGWHSGFRRLNLLKFYSIFLYLMILVLYWHERVLSFFLAHLLCPGSSFRCYGLESIDFKYALVNSIFFSRLQRNAWRRFVCRAVMYSLRHSTELHSRHAY
jgi:hypothetical protein